MARYLTKATFDAWVSETASWALSKASAGLTAGLDLGDYKIWSDGRIQSPAGGTIRSHSGATVTAWIRSVADGSATYYDGTVKTGNIPNYYIYVNIVPASLSSIPPGLEWQHDSLSGSNIIDQGGVFSFFAPGFRTAAAYIDV